MLNNSKTQEGIDDVTWQLKIWKSLQ